MYKLNKVEDSGLKWRISGRPSGGTEQQHKYVIPYCYSVIYYIYITYILKME